MRFGSLGIVLVSQLLCSGAVAETCLAPIDREAALRAASSVEGPRLTDHERLLVAFDRTMNRKRLVNIFDCLIRQRPTSENIKSYFGDEPFEIDDDLYQFVFSDFNYGKILVNSASKSSYLQGLISPNLKIMKVTFDFSAAGDPVISELFTYTAARPTERFGKFVGTQLVTRDLDCRSCHTGGPDELFFKDRFRRLIER